MGKQQTVTLSVREAVNLLGTRLDYFYRLLQAGAISAVKVDGEYRVDRRSLEAYRASHPKLGRARQEQALAEAAQAAV